MDFVGYLFMFSLGVFTGSLATSWVNIICSHHEKSQREEAPVEQEKFDRYA